MFGGEKTRFSAVCANGESVFLAGHKVPGGGGDFGNGGRYVDTVFVVSLDDELNISESRVLASTDKIVSCVITKTGFSWFYPAGFINSTTT